MSTPEKIRKKKVVVEVDKNGKFVGFFASVTECAEAVGCPQGVISMILHRTRKHFHQRYFRVARPEEVDQFDKFQAKVVSQEQAKLIIVTPEEPQLIDIPAETIPAVIGRPPVDDDLSPFEQMLKRRNLKE